MTIHHLANSSAKRYHNRSYSLVPGGGGKVAPATPRPRLYAHWSVDEDGKLSCRWEVEP